MDKMQLSKIFTAKEAVIKYDWEGGGRNLNFSAKIFRTPLRKNTIFSCPSKYF